MSWSRNISREIFELIPIMPNQNNLHENKPPVGCGPKIYPINKHRIQKYVPTILAFVLIAVLYSLYGLVFILDGILPTPLNKENEINNPDSFITERAQLDLKDLTDLGPRVTGSYENEVLAVDLLKNKIVYIQSKANINQSIELDVQLATGSFYLNFKPRAGIAAYANLQNIVVKLHGKNSSHSVLVNAHFDSVPTSPGGSDDGINCAVMLEILRKLSRSPYRLQHNVIFLFNGAEETPLQAAHAFITQHKWANDIKVLVNLEGAGVGGKENLFQIGPEQPWLMDYYQKVPHPHGQAAGEELFQTGLIPSGTDFKVFKEFGNLIGVDFAFTKNGYRYHTKYDDFSSIPLGSYQHIGDNTLSLIKNLGDAPELFNLPQPKGNVVFYDILGLFIISYSETFAIVINVITILLSIAVGAKAFYDFRCLEYARTKYYLCKTLVLIFLSWIMAVIFVVLLALILDALNFSMSWYGNPWIILGLYATPVFVCCCLPLAFLNHYYINEFDATIQIQLQTHLLRLIWTTILLIGTCLGFRFVYVIMIPILFHTITFVIIQIFRLYPGKIWAPVYITGTIIPTLFLMAQALNITSVLIPICGRIGPDKNPELIVGLLVLLLTLLITSCYVPLITLIHHQFLFLASLTGVFLVFLIITFTPVAFPYSSDINSPAPQRFWIYHTARIVRNDSNAIIREDAGFFLLNMDRNSPLSVKHYLSDYGKLDSMENNWSDIMFCGLPMTTLRVIPILNKGSWIPAELPIISEPSEIKLNYRQEVSNSTTRFNLSASGPDHFAIYISPKPNVILVNISLVPTVPPPTLISNDRPVYAVLYTWGKIKSSLTFTVDFKVPPNWDKLNYFDIAIAGSYLHNTVNKTQHYQDFLKEFPEWADIQGFVGIYESWVY